LIVGQIAYVLPPKNFIEGYDLILSRFRISFQNQSGRRRIEYFRLGFDPRVTRGLTGERDIDVSFVGAIGAATDRGAAPGTPLPGNPDQDLMAIAPRTFDADSPIRTKVRKEVWAPRTCIACSRPEARSRQPPISRRRNVLVHTLRLYEATGMVRGCCSIPVCQRTI